MHGRDAAFSSAFQGLGMGVLTAGGRAGQKEEKADNFQKMNRIFGVVLSMFGILVFIRAVLI